MRLIYMKFYSQRYYIIFSGIILVISLAWMVITAIYFDKSPQGSITAPKQGFLAPNFNLESMTGEGYNLSSLRGKVILLNFWASWCPPCRTEMPAMQRVYNDYKEQGVIILAVNATNQDTLEKAEEFVAANGLTFPVLLDIDGFAIYSYQVRSFPTSFFIDHNGIVREIVIGGPMSQTLIETRVRSLINQEY